ncbi:MAG: Gfo/Idh/MocA family oxidoreductase [Candidatus Eisenbacteria bacterium]
MEPMSDPTTAMSAMSEHDATPEPDATTRERVVVAGLGRAGLDHACAFAMHPSAQLAGLVEPRNELRRFMRGIGFTAPSETSLERWLEKHACDSVVVCAPAAEALETVETAVKSGLGVLVHGLANMPAEIATRIQATLASSERPVAAGAPVLFHPLFARARRSGALSPERVTQVRASASVSRVFSPLADPGGRDVLDFLLADLLLLLDASFGPVVAVKAKGQKLYADWFDECQVEARFANGLKALIDASWSVPDYPSAAMVIECAGPEGRVIVSDDALEMDMASLQGRVVVSSEPSQLRYDSGDHAGVAEGFLRMLGGDPVATSALSVTRAANVARVVDAVRASIHADAEEREVQS